MPKLSRKIEYLLLIAIFLLYTLIGHMLNIDVLKIFTIRRDEFSISIVGVVISVATLFALSFLIAKFKKID